MGNNSFTVLPMSQRFQLEPGKTYEGKVTVVNPADATNDFKYKVAVSPYGVTDENYTADLTTDYTRSAIAKWITIDEPTGSVKPNESKDVTFKIAVPDNAPGGGQYATIVISSDNDTTEESGVAIYNIFEMASVVYGSVAGEIKHGGEVLENEVPGFVVSTPITLTALISNEGNVHDDATFIISVTNFFTGQVILPTDEDDGEYSELIMPETTKKVERQISNLPALGVVKVKQTIYYLGHEPSIVEKNVIICPIWFLILLIATICAIITTIVLIIKRHKKTKKAKKASLKE